MSINLCELRKAKNLTQAEVGRKSGVSQQMVALIEIGARNPSVSVAKRLGKTLGIKWTKFFE